MLAKALVASTFAVQGGRLVTRPRPNNVNTRSTTFDPAVMHMLNASEANTEDALKVLGRVADAFDNPSLHKTDKELKLFMINVVKSPRHLLTSLASEESVCQDGSYDSSFDITYDEDVELGDVSIREHAASYPYAPRSPYKQRNRAGGKDKGMYEVTKMLLTSSPLDRLDRLARMELRKTGWIERVDKWTIVEMGLQGVPEPATPKTPTKRAGLHTRDSWDNFLSTKAMLVNDGKQPPRTPRRTGTNKRWDDTPERVHRPTSGTPASMRSTVASDDSLSYSKLGRASRFGQVMRNIVKRMLPPSSVSPYSREMMTPRSDVSAESGWSSGSASSWWTAMLG